MAPVLRAATTELRILIIAVSIRNASSPFQQGRVMIDVTMFTGQISWVIQRKLILLVIVIRYSITILLLHRLFYSPLKLDGTTASIAINFNLVLKHVKRDILEISNFVKLRLLLQLVLIMDSNVSGTTKQDNARRTAVLLIFVAPRMRV